MLQVLQERLADVSYDYFRCQTLAKELAAEIQSRARDFRWARYKILCQVPLVDCVSRLLKNNQQFLVTGSMDRGNILALIFPPCHSFFPLSNLSFLLSRFLLSHSSFVLSHSFSFFLMHRSVGQFRTDLFRAGDPWAENSAECASGQSMFMGPGCGQLRVSHLRHPVCLCRGAVLRCLL